MQAPARLTAQPTSRKDVNAWLVGEAARRPPPFRLAFAGNKPTMRGISLGGLYLIIGLVVAAVKDYFDDIGTLRALLEALIVILIWPLVLLGVDVNVR
jgi:hypothetical protein